MLNALSQCETIKTATSSSQSLSNLCFAERLLSIVNVVTVSEHFFGHIDNIYICDGLMKLKGTEEKDGLEVPKRKAAVYNSFGCTTALVVVVE